MDLTTETLLALDLVTERLKVRILEKYKGYGKEFFDGYNYAISDLETLIEEL